MKTLLGLFVFAAYLNSVPCMGGEYGEDAQNLKSIQAQPNSVSPFANSNAETIINNTFGNYLKTPPVDKRKVTTNGLSFIFKMLNKYPKQYVPANNPCQLDSPPDTGFFSHLNKLSTRKGLKDSCKVATPNCVNEKLLDKTAECTTINAQVLRDLFPQDSEKSALETGCVGATPGVIQKTGENCVKNSMQVANSIAEPTPGASPTLAPQPVPKKVEKRVLHSAPTVAEIHPSLSSSKTKPMRRAQSFDVPKNFNEIPSGIVQSKSTDIRKAFVKPDTAGKMRVVTLSDLRPYIRSDLALRQSLGLPKSPEKYDILHEKEKNLGKSPTQRAKDTNLPLDLYQGYKPAEREVVFESYQADLNQFIHKRISNPEAMTDELKRQILLTSFLLHTQQIQKKNLQYTPGQLGYEKGESYVGGFKTFITEVLLGAYKTDKNVENVSLNAREKISIEKIQERLGLFYDKNEKAIQAHPELAEEGSKPTREFPGIAVEQIIYKPTTNYKKEKDFDPKIKSMFPPDASGYVITGVVKKPMYDQSQYEVVFKVKRQLKGFNHWEWGYIQITDMKEDLLKKLTDLSKNQLLSFVVPFDLANSKLPTILGVPVEKSAENPYNYYVLSTPHNAIPSSFAGSTLEIRKAFEKDSILPVAIDKRTP